MPVAVSYPGVYIEEVPSGVRTITGVATSITAFIGGAPRGELDKPVTIFSYGDFERFFGGLSLSSKLGYAVRDFYLNGGSQAIIVRVFNGDVEKSKATVENTASAFAIAARDPGAWGANLRFTIDFKVAKPAVEAMDLPPDTPVFNLTVFEVGPNGTTLRSEQFRNLTASEGVLMRRIDKVLAAESALVRWKGKFEGANSYPRLGPIQTAQADLAAAVKALAAAAPAEVEAKRKEVGASTAALALLAQDDVQRTEQSCDAAGIALDKAKRATAPVQADIDAANAALTASETRLASLKATRKGADSLPLTKAQFTPDLAEAAKTGMHALDQADLFNLLCIPPYLETGVDDTLVGEAAAYCERRRAMLLVDPKPAWGDAAAAIAGVGQIGTTSKNAALFFPMLVQSDSLRDNQMANFAPCGAIAGVFARTDTQRGVWKAPAGLDTTLVGVPRLSVPLTDGESGRLNPMGINCLRSIPATGRVVWGARTLQGDDWLESEWKYIPVRRTALYIEESLYRGTQWVEFEPNDEPLWAQIRLNLGAFMHKLFRQGAFQGQTPQDAYFVKCDKETTTPSDINLGIVNIVVGFAALKPAEFVVIRLQQIAGQIQA